MKLLCLGLLGLLYCHCLLLLNDSSCLLHSRVCIDSLLYNGLINACLLQLVLRVLLHILLVILF